LRADDEEYSVIPKSFFAVLWFVCCALTRVFFDGALAEAPASARPVKLTAANRAVSMMAARRVVMVSSDDPKYLDSKYLDSKYLDSKYLDSKHLDSKHLVPSPTIKTTERG
jgi:hypothetical protein